MSVIALYLTDVFGYSTALNGYFQASLPRATATLTFPFSLSFSHFSQPGGE
jgi:hypothetical protein